MSVLHSAVISALCARCDLQEPDFEHRFAPPRLWRFDAAWIEAKVALDNGRSVIIFPEGTRVAAGEKPPLRSGFAGLYRVLGLGVVPIAINSGDVWPKKGPKRPGVVTFLFGERIPPKLPREEIEARVHAAINRLD